MTARRYEPLLKIASGGTAAVYVGSAVGALGFRQLVAIKRPHAHLADDPAFCAALVEEAKIASRLHHANVVDVRDVEVDESGIQLVMDYVEGASLSELIRSWGKEPPARREAIALRIVLDACEGLRAVHALRGDDGKALGLVHRDVSPANVLVGLDGVARIADFGLAKPLLAVERTTSEGALRGKLGYMAPEYIRGKTIDQRIDVFAMGIVLWEVLAGKRLFRGENDGDTLERVQQMQAPALASVAAHLGAAAADLDGVIALALAKDPNERLATMDALAAALEKVVRTHDLTATHGEVRDAFAPALKAHLEDRRRRVHTAQNEAQPVSAASASPVSQPPPASIASNTPPALSASASQGTVAAKGARPVPAALLAVIGAVVVAIVATTAILVRRTAEPDASAAAPREAVAAHTPAPEVEPLAGEARTRDPASSSSAVDEPTAPSARGSHAATRAPSRPSPISDEPGKKPPRPNPYATAAPPH